MNIHAIGLVLLLSGCAAGPSVEPLSQALVSDEIIHACYQDVKGDLRVRVAGSREMCKSDELPISWNVQGPTGPEGPSGPEGPPGPKGPPGPAGPATSALDAQRNAHDSFTVCEVQEGEFGCHFVDKIIPLLGPGAYVINGWVQGASSNKCVLFDPSGGIIDKKIFPFSDAVRVPFAGSFVVDSARPPNLKLRCQASGANSVEIKYSLNAVKVGELTQDHNPDPCSDTGCD